MTKSDKLADLRREYSKGFLDPEEMPEHPIVEFKKWFELAVAEVKHDANAMVLATVEENRPVARVVLLKECNDTGLVFYTNYQSRKGVNLQLNPNAALCFFWPDLERQVRVEGKVHKTTAAESDAYFRSRPRLSQAGAIASAQSTEIPDRNALELRMAELMQKPEAQQLERPEHWGGYELVPDYFEFWQGREGRLHDRICYELEDGHWRKFRLSP